LPSLRAEEFDEEERAEESEAKDEEDERSESDTVKGVRMCRSNEVASEGEGIDGECGEGPEEKGSRGVNEERMRSGQEEMGE